MHLLSDTSFFAAMEMVAIGAAWIETTVHMHVNGNV